MSYVYVMSSDLMIGSSSIVISTISYIIYQECVLE